ncbi:MAG: BrnA antitoxin family protein [Azoarcus sp.]|jgi:predicted DNA binding CopG/RHH family protein|nr:BrnA antitoxin family protein [Azoarcus sp.]
MRKEYDFSESVRARDVPHLLALQVEAADKTRITIRVDNRTLAVFRARAAALGGNYQTLMNEALNEYATGLTLADVVRETIREELHPA